MDDKQIRSILQDALEEEIPSSEVKLWPAIQASLVPGRKSTVQQGENMNSVSSRRISRVALAVLVIGALMAVAFITPQGRAFAQTVLQFFKRAESNVIPLPTEMILSPEEAQAMPTAQPPAPMVSVPEAEKTAGFDVMELPTIPDGFVIVGAMATPGSINIHYEAIGGGGALVITQSTDGYIESEWDEAPSAAISPVRIGDLDAEVVQGTYVVYPGETVRRWNPDMPILRLRWVRDGIWFEMTKFGDVERIVYLDQDTLIELAASLTNDPSPVIMTIAEAEAQAGFDVLEPTWVPNVLSLRGAAFEAAQWKRKQDTVRIFYDLRTIETNGIVLSQQPIESIEDCEFCDFVGADANVESVQVGAVTGEYVVGVWEANEAGDWIWVNEPYLQTLRWQQDDMAFEILYMGPPDQLTKADLIAIAESVK